MKQNDKKKTKKKAPSGPPVQGGTDRARQIGAAVLEVLGGVLRPSEAARVLEVSLPRYYQLELRALEGLVKACEPSPKGPAADPSKQIARLESRIQRLQNECLRFQSLARAAGRAVGVNVTKIEKETSGKRRRKPTVRALKVAKVLAPASKEEAPPAKEVK